jgi:biopolymer transport protein ExbD
MKQFSRAARMDRHHERNKKNPGLNLVSLMDIFTILVFFLLVNSSEVQDLPSAKSIEMPESVSEQKPRETVVVLVSNDQILVQGVPVMAVADALAAEGNVIAPLAAALDDQARRLVRDESSAADREVTILGDKSVPYRLLRKVMATCTDADYGRVSLAVMQKAPERAES